LLDRCLRGPVQFYLSVVDGAVWETCQVLGCRGGDCPQPGVLGSWRRWRDRCVADDCPGMIDQGRLGEPPWTVEQLVTVRDAPHDRSGRRTGVHSEHGTEARWVAGCNCRLCTAENRKRAPGSRTGQCAGPAASRNTRRAPGRDCRRQSVQAGTGPVRTDLVERSRPSGIVSTTADGHPPRGPESRHPVRLRSGVCLPRLPRTQSGTLSSAAKPGHPLRP